MRKIKWGVLGTAGIARLCTIPGMKLAENCELYAIAGRSLEKAEQFKETFGFEKAYGSYAELLEDPDVEAVYIPLPNDLHKEWSIKALNAKKHVLCEKPIAPNAEDAAEMIAAAEANGVYLMEAFAYLHSPIMTALKAEIEAGTIGELQYMESAFLTGARPDTDIRMRKETFGGSMYDLGCYCTSQILWLFGEEPVEVKAVADFTNQGIDSYTAAVVYFEGGRRAELNTGMMLPPKTKGRLDRCGLYGTKGFIESDMQFNQEGEISYTICVDGQKETKTVLAPQNYSLEVAQLGRCITDGEKPYVSNEFTMKNARLMDMILKAINY